MGYDTSLVFFVFKNALMWYDLANQIYNYMKIFFDMLAYNIWLINTYLLLNKQLGIALTSLTGIINYCITYLMWKQSKYEYNNT